MTPLRDKLQVAWRVRRCRRRLSKEADALVTVRSFLSPSSP